jgi:hypothetical protein
MAPLPCPRCHRANPADAKFCYYDGVELAAASGNGRDGAMGREFVFPTGQRCRTYDELVKACSDDWQIARDILRQGGLRQFLAGIGRLDLAAAADQAAAKDDLDVGLDQLLAQMPTRDAIGPQLDLKPRRINIGQMKVGESRQIQLSVLNPGTRLLLGKIQVEGGEWVRLGPFKLDNMPIKTGKQQAFALHIDAIGLVAGQHYIAKLTVITNGGAVEVPIAMEIAPVPFAHAPLQGATSPRDLAAKMKDVAKQVGPLLESGEVQRWFTANGWAYPVRGPTAKGVAGVQQFFEGLGLSKPPLLAVSEEEMLLICQPGQIVHGNVLLRTAAKKWVFARAESNKPWLNLLDANVNGAQQAQVSFMVTARELPRGRQEADLTITGNGGQRFVVKVRAEVRAPRATTGMQLQRLLVLGALCGFLFRLVVSFPDLYARQQLLEFGALMAFRQNDTIRPDDYMRDFTLALAWLGLPLGAWLLWRRSGLRDVPVGLLVGGVTGLMAGATFACLLRMVEETCALVLPTHLAGVAIVIWTFGGVGLAVLANLVGGAWMARLERFFAPILRLFGADT